MKYEIITGESDSIVLVVNDEIMLISDDISDILHTLGIELTTNSYKGTDITIVDIPATEDKEEVVPDIEKLGKLFDLG